MALKTRRMKKTGHQHRQQTEIKQNNPVKLSIQTRLEMSKGKSRVHKSKCRVEERNSNAGAAGAKPTLSAKQRQKGNSDDGEEV